MRVSFLLHLLPLVVVLAASYVKRSRVRTRAHTLAHLFVKPRDTREGESLSEVRERAAQATWDTWV